MNDETRTVSVEVPAEILKTISTATKEAKTAPEARTLVTLQFSAEAVNKLTALTEDFAAFQQSLVSASHAVVDRLIKTNEMRISFYEKLILLAGGSFALSLTFVGTLHRLAPQGSPLAAVGRLKAAWILLLVCIVFSWLHNLYRCAAVDHATAANALLVTATQQSRASNLLTRGAGLLKAAESPSVGLSDGITSLVLSRFL